MSDLSNAEYLATFHQMMAAQAAGSMLDFTLYTNPAYETGWFNELICAELDQFLLEVEQGLCPRLMLFAPPRSGKSELASRRFPAYSLGKHPDWGVIACSYSADVANRMSRDCQRIIEAPRFAEVFPGVGLSGKKKRVIRTAELWELCDSNGDFLGGSYRAAGVGGGITSMGMNIGIIDDPAKDFKQASSLAYQAAVMDWYETTFYTRRDPKINGIIIILTRWHKNDLAGQLLKRTQEGGEKFRVVSFPMVAEAAEYHELAGKRYKLREPGEILFPERMPPKFVEQCRASGSLTWNALYQQRPTEKGGTLIKSDWFGEYSVLPKLRWRCIIGDTAQKVKQRNDFSVFEHWGLGEDGYLYLIDLIRGKWESDELKRRASAFWDKSVSLPNGRLRWMGIEDKASGTGLIQQIKKATTKNCPVRAIQRDKDKLTRLMDVQGYIESGYLKLPDSAPWLNDFLVECEGITPEFKNHDDQIDPMIDAIDLMLGKARPSVSETL